MLAASLATPNMQNRESPKPAPTPDNWHGVAAGLSRANRHVCDGLYHEAVNTLKGVLEFAPSEPQAWRLLGDILKQHGHTEKADICHGKAARFERHSSNNSAATPASERLAKLLWSQGENEAALAMLAVLLLRKPDDTKLLTLRDMWRETIQATDR